MAGTGAGPGGSDLGQVRRGDELRARLGGCRRPVGASERDGLVG